MGASEGLAGLAQMPFLPQYARFLPSLMPAERVSRQSPEGNNTMGSSTAALGCHFLCIFRPQGVGFLTDPAGAWLSAAHCSFFGDRIVATTGCWGYGKGEITGHVQFLGVN